MAFKRKRKVYVLDFDGTEYEGLEVKVGGLTTGEYLELVGLSAPGNDGTGETEKMLQFFSAHLRSWNLLDEDDVPVPTTFDGVKTNDLTMNMFIVGAWTDALASVPEKTGKESTSGDLTLSSIPVESLA